MTTSFLPDRDGVRQQLVTYCCRCGTTLVAGKRKLDAKVTQKHDPAVARLPAKAALSAPSDGTLPAEYRSAGIHRGSAAREVLHPKFPSIGLIDKEHRVRPYGTY